MKKKKKGMEGEGVGVGDKQTERRQIYREGDERDSKERRNIFEFTVTYKYDKYNIDMIYYQRVTMKYIYKNNPSPMHSSLTDLSKQYEREGAKYMHT